MHLELNHSIAGTWSDPVDIDSREPEIKATFPLKTEENIIRWTDWMPLKTTTFCLTLIFLHKKKPLP